MFNFRWKLKNTIKKQKQPDSLLPDKDGFSVSKGVNGIPSDREYADYKSLRRAAFLADYSQSAAQ